MVSSGVRLYAFIMMTGVDAWFWGVADFRFGLMMGYVYVIYVHWDINKLSAIFGTLLSL